MSHLVCPLCGKNAPLSTLNPEAIDLDIKVVSFKGLGYRRGFAKSEEHSILGDDEYSPMLAKKNLQLCNMFISAGVLKRSDVENALNIDSKRDNNSLIAKVKGSQNVIASLESQLRERNEENEIKEQVDYIIREGVKFTSPGSITADAEGWYLKLTPDELELGLYLHLVIRELPIKLKNRLLPHILADEDPLWYEYFLKDVPKRKSIAELLLDEDSRGVVHLKEEDGTVRELRYESVHLFNQEENTISMKTLKEIVSDAKNLMNDPDDVEKLRKILRG